jgi:phospholipase/carboxylesterase
LFRKIIALSPGFVAPGPPHGRPKIFIAHGKDDQVLPFDSTSNAIVPVLRDHGYEVTFRLHPEGHVPGPRLDDAADWYARS